LLPSPLPPLPMLLLLLLLPTWVLSTVHTSQTT
jgi:hypothetical protein